MPSITSLIIACCVIYYSAHGCLADTQIVGGTDAPDGQYPYQVSLKDPFSERHFCGGAIVSKRYVITAAHCLDGRQSPSYVRVDVGSNFLLSQTAYSADALIIHPGYNKTQNLNDIGLIRLSKEITFKKNTTESILLISSNQDFEGVDLTVTGWGQFRKDGPSSYRLQQVTVKGFSQKKCAETYAGISNVTNITDSHLCTLQTVGQGVCYGDSGGALTLKGKLVGIVSFGVPCAEGFPDVFTRVYYYRDWVNKYINAGSNQQLNILLGLFTTYLCIYSFL